jgi:hypothetical protein
MGLRSVLTEQTGLGPGRAHGRRFAAQDVPVRPPPRGLVGVYWPANGARMEGYMDEDGFSGNRALRVSRAIWDWREPSAGPVPEPVWAPLVRMLVIMGAFAGLALWRGHRSVACALGGYGLLNVLMALLWPAGFRAHARFWQKLGRSGAAVIGVVMLTAVYVLIFTPAGFALRLLGRDPLRRRFPGREKTYWQPVARHRRPDRYYTRQF